MAPTSDINAYKLLRMAYTIRGLSQVFLGIVLLIWPKISLGLLLMIFWLFLFADGLIQIIAAIRLWRNQASSWPVLVFSGLIEISSGIFFLMNLERADASMVSILIIIIALRGLTSLFLMTDKLIRSRERILLFGIALLSLVFGILMLGISDPTFSNVGRVFGIYSLCAGILRFLLGQGFKKDMDLLLFGKHTTVAYQQRPQATSE